MKKLILILLILVYTITLAIKCSGQRPRSAYTKARWVMPALTGAGAVFFISQGIWYKNHDLRKYGNGCLAFGGVLVASTVVLVYQIGRRR